MLLLYLCLILQNILCGWVCIGNRVGQEKRVEWFDDLNICDTPTASDILGKISCGIIARIALLALI